VSGRDSRLTLVKSSKGKTPSVLARVLMLPGRHHSVAASGIKGTRLFHFCSYSTNHIIAELCCADQHHKQ